jgi:hypothetical protein
MSMGVSGQVTKKRMLHSFEIGCDGLNSNDVTAGGASGAGGAASIAAEPDGAARPAYCS